jgi:hypothetical protein
MSKGSASARKPISTRTRFEIFKRDGFVCQYCGRHPPDIILNVDHIIAIANGGDNSRDNLTTSCRDCNYGKNAVPLSAIPQSLSDKAALISEREKQLKGFRRVIQAQKIRQENDCWNVVRVGWPDATSWPKRDFLTIKRFIDRLSYEEVIEAMEIASAKFPYGGNSCWKYFCGVSWRKITEAEGSPT